MNSAIPLETCSHAEQCGTKNIPENHEENSFPQAPIQELFFHRITWKKQKKHCVFLLGFVGRKIESEWPWVLSGEVYTDPFPHPEPKLWEKAKLHKSPSLHI